MSSSDENPTPFSITATRLWWAKRRRMVWAVVIAMVASFLVVGLQAAPAIADSTATISGNVEGLGNPNVNLQGVDVQVWSYGTEVADATTDSNGNYTISGLNPDEDTVEFYQGTSYVTQWWQNEADQDSATYFILSAGQTLSGINAVMVPGATISGNVKGQGEPNVNLDDAEVYAYSSDGIFRGSAETDADGNYTILDLPARNYTLDVVPNPGDNYSEGFWDGESTYQSADYFAVSVGQAVTGKNLVLSAGGTIAGTVEGQGTPDVPLAGVSVNVYNVSDVNLSYSAQTDSSGNYSVVGLPEGTYQVEFAPADGLHLSAQLTGNVVVGAAQTVGSEDITLPLGATIGGNVQEAGTPNTDLGGVYACAVDSSENDWGCAQTDGSGNYEINGLPSGSYTVAFNDASTAPAIDEQVGGQWWNDEASFTAADLFNVTAGQVITGKDAVLSPSGTISGTVTSQASGHPLAGVEVYAAEGDSSAAGGGSVYTDSNGNYTITGLPQGSYDVNFDTSDASPAGNYVSALWWNGVPDQSAATAVSVGAAQNVAGISVAIPAGASVSGTVTDSSNHLLSGLDVSAETADGTGYGVGGYTDANGDFTIAGLPAGSYTLDYTYDNGGGVVYGKGPSPYIEQWWQGQSSLSTANFFSVAAGQVITGKNATLEPAPASGSISGTVEGAGSPNVTLEGVTIVVYCGYDANYIESECGFGATDSNGNYSLTDFGPGPYVICFSESNVNQYASVCSGGAASVGAATPVVVDAGQQTTENVVLPAASSVSGAVTAGGSGLAGTVYVYDSNATADSYTSLVSSAQTSADGTYTVPGLPPGSYKVGFTTQSSDYSDDGPLPSSDPYVSQWYSTKYSYATAGSVSVPSAGSAVTGINFAIEDPTFADVSDPTYVFYNYIQWMASDGISTGTAQPSGKPLYLPSNPVSRQAMASFMYKLSGDTFTPPSTPTFADVPTTNPFYTAIEWMAAQGISTGTAQSSGKPLFAPANPVSRSAMALFLARYAHADLSTPPTTQSFADVPIDSAPAAAIGWMASTGISTGTAQPSGLPLYQPSSPVSRSAMAAFLYRLAHLPS